MTHTPLLIAEDEENDIFFLQRALQKVGIPNPVTFVQSGAEVIDYLKGAGKFADRHLYPAPMLLLLDLKLPFMSGTDVLKWIRQDPGWCRLPVVVLTSSSLSTDIHQAYNAGANSYVVKPADPEQMVQLVRDFAGWWLRQNVAPP